jgi:hypothetical protein
MSRFSAFRNPPARYQVENVDLRVIEIADWASAKAIELSSAAVVALICRPVQQLLS